MLSLGLWLFFAASFSTIAQAAPGLAQDAAEIASQTDAPFAIADFDGDRQLDIASVQVGQVGTSETRYWIHFRLSSGVRQFIPVTAPLGGLHIASQDVNGDSFVDLIITTAWHEFPVAVLLNDGQGNFTLRDPHAFPAVMAHEHTSSASARGNADDIAAALLPGSSFGRCEAVQGTALSDNRSGSLCTPVSHQKNFSLVEWVLGRAPPLSPLHS